MFDKKSSQINFFFCRSSDAICEDFELELGDIIILSTDGLFDNIPNHIIEHILSRVNNHFRLFLSRMISFQSRTLKDAVHALVHRAVKFYIKPDDILIIMARVTNPVESMWK